MDANNFAFVVDTIQDHRAPSPRGPSMKRTRSLGVACSFVLASYALAVASCQHDSPKAAEPPRPAAPGHTQPSATMPVPQAASAQPPATPSAPAPAPQVWQDDPEHCPPGMAFVSENDYCPEVERKCLHE